MPRYAYGFIDGGYHTDLGTIEEADEETAFYKAGQEAWDQYGFVEEVEECPSCGVDHRAGEACYFCQITFPKETTP